MNTTVSSTIDLREKSRFSPLYYSYSKPLREVRCFPKTPDFSLWLTVGIAQRGKSSVFPRINRTGNCRVWGNSGGWPQNLYLGGQPPKSPGLTALPISHLLLYARIPRNCLTVRQFGVLFPIPQLAFAGNRRVKEWKRGRVAGKITPEITIIKIRGILFPS